MAANLVCTIAQSLSRGSTPVLYARTSFLPGDETFFHLFPAGSEEAVGEVCRQAGIGSARIVPALE